MTIDPVVLFFLLGVAARLLKSDLRLPEPIYEGLSVYLLLALGLKGGIELARHPWINLAPQIAGVLVMGAVLPVLAFAVLRLLGKLSHVNAAAVAAHYGSVSVVTFAAGMTWIEARGVPAEAYMPLFVALLEAPGIIVGVLLARSLGNKGREAAGGGAAAASGGAGSSAGAGASSGGAATAGWANVLREVMAGKSIILLIGGLVIGAILGPQGVKPVAPWFFDLFKGALTLFMLELGLVVGRQIGVLRTSGAFMLVFGIATPLVFGFIGAALGLLLNLSSGGAFILAVLAASASYIAAPAAMRAALPEANPGLSLPIVLGVTFPFNLIVGFPIYHAYVVWLKG